MTKTLYTCPVCGFLTFAEPPGSYDLCEVCGWEDDGVQLANPACSGGANCKSLMEAQEKAIKDYPLSITEIKGRRRNPKWRPLTNEEKEIYNQQMDADYWMNMAIVTEEAAYWNTDEVPREIEESWFAGETIRGINFCLNDAVSITLGPHSGECGAVISILRLTPEPEYLIELGSGKGDIKVTQSKLVKCDT